MSRRELAWVALVLVSILVVAALVVVPALNCADDGGLPVLGVGRVVCAQPFSKGS